MLVAIGDIHGHYHALCRLLDRIKAAGIDFTRDTLVFLGDYVDGGFDTRRVIGLLMVLERQYPHWVFLLGNHEDMLLNALDDPREWSLWYTQGGRATLQSYTEMPKPDEDFWPEHVFGHFTQPAMANLIPAEHIAWLRARPLLHQTAAFAFVHAGLDPAVAKIEANSRETMLWIREPFIASERDWGKRVIFGHTYFRRPLVMLNKIGIDTMHRGGGHLTAVVLDEAALDDARFVQ